MSADLFKYFVKLFYERLGLWLVNRCIFIKWDYVPTWDPLVYNDRAFVLTRGQTPTDLSLAPAQATDSHHLLIAPLQESPHLKLDHPVVYY